MAKKNLTQEIDSQESPSLVDTILSRPQLELDPLIATAEATSAIVEGFKNIQEVARVEFIRKNREQQKNLNKYFCGLIPIVNRKTIHVCGGVTLSMFSGISRETSSGDMAVVRDIGSVLLLDDDELKEAIDKIKKIGLKFHFKGATASVFKIQESEPSQRYWAKGEYPLGQFCYLESVPHLNKLFGNESGWRSKDRPMRTLIPRIEISHDYRGTPTEDMGDGWTGYWTKTRRDPEEVIEIEVGK